MPVMSTTFCLLEKMETYSAKLVSPTQFRRGDWEKGKLTQCGVLAEQTASDSEFSRPNGIDSLSEAIVKSQLRAICPTSRLSGSGR